MPASQDTRNPTANSTARWIELGLGAQTKSSCWANVGHNDEEACTVFPGRMGMVVKNVEYKRIYDEGACSRITIRQCWMKPREQALHRFDFDEEAAVKRAHPRSRSTLGPYRNCRIPVSVPLTPSLLLDVVYGAAHSRESQDGDAATDRWPDVLAEPEKKRAPRANANAG